MTLKQSIYHAITSRRLAPLWRRVWPDNILCLCLHRVGAARAGYPGILDDLSVSPEFLEHFVADARAQGYTFLSLDTLYKALTEQMPWPNRGIVLTFDDGYRDNLDAALPVLKRHGVPFAVYLSTLYVDEEILPWWFALAELLREREVLVNGARVDVASLEALNAAFRAIEAAALCDSKGAQAYVAALCRRYDFIPNYRRLFLSWEEIRTMCGEELVTFGNHGHGHINMELSSREDIHEDFLRAATLFYEHTGRKLTHYCFPYGLYNEGALNVLAELEVKTCMTTFSHWTSGRNHGNCHRIPRVTLLEENVDTPTVGNLLGVNLWGTLKVLLRKKY